MDGDDRSARGQRRQHVVRGMKEIRPRASEIERHGELLGDRVVSRAVGHRTKVVTELLDVLAVLTAAEEDILGLLVQTREPAHEISHIGADAEVVQLPNVDRDPHLVSRVRCSRIFSRRSIPPGCVAPRSNTTGMLPRRAVPARRRAPENSPRAPDSGHWEILARMTATALSSAPG